MTQNTARTVEGRDQKSGRFLAGNSGNGGRKPGSRNKLAEAFVADVYVQWQKSGANALEEMVKNDPSSFCRLVGNILPREIDEKINIEVGLFAEVRDFRAAFRVAKAFLSKSELDPETKLLIGNHYEDG